MTARSVRRDAELEVIEAGRALMTSVRAAFDYTPDDDRYEGPAIDTTALSDALKALDALPLPDASAARSSKGAPLTSQNAAAYVRGPRAASLSGRIVRRLWAHDIGMTVEELCESLDRKHQSVSARVHDLKEMGWITGSDDYTRTTRSGSEAVMWRISRRARFELEDAAAEHRERVI